MVRVGPSRARAQNIAAPVATEQSAEPPDAAAQLRKEAAKAAAAEAQLEKIRRAADKAAKLQAANGVEAATLRLVLDAVRS